MQSNILKTSLEKLMTITPKEIQELKHWYETERKQAVKIPAIICTTFLLSGCVAAWGSSYNVAMSNSRSVVIEYDRVVANLPAMLNAAQTECNKYGKDAVLDSVSGGNLGIRVNTYRCETRTADTVIDVQG